MQLYGFAKPMNATAPTTMEGVYADATVPAAASFVLSAQNMSSLPVLSQLALEYAAFDRWFASAPTCTNPNREFAWSGTNNGVINNDFPKALFAQQTYFSFLEEHGWCVQCGGERSHGEQRHWVVVP